VASRLCLLLICAAALAGSAVAAGDPRDPKRRHNAADQAWAEAIRVQRPDLGGGDWRVETSDDSDRGAPKQCKDPDLSDLVETGSAEKPDWSRNGSFVGSGSIVFRTERQLTTAWNRVARRPFTDCFIWAMKKGAAGSGVSISVSSKGPVRIAKLAPLFKTGRVAVTVKGPNATVKGRLSYYLAGRGRASVILVIMSFGRPATPISEALERRIVQRVTARLKH
jgi:hypothetical protein